MYNSLVTAIRQGEADDSVRVQVLLGQPGVFTAGNDIEDFIASTTEQGGLGAVIEFLYALSETTKPLVAGVDGIAVGVGTTMLMHCDLVYATEGAVFATPFTNLGLVPEAASSLLGPRLIGQQRAFALFALGEKLGAREAVNAGLVHKLVDQQNLDEQVMSVASQLAAKPGEALLETRRLLRGDPVEIRQRIDAELKIFSRLLESEDARKAFAAFMPR